MIILTISTLIISVLLIFFLVFPFISVLLGRKKKEILRFDSTHFTDHDFGCIITAYRNAEIAQPLVHSLLNQRYKNFHIYLVADECDLSEFRIYHEQLSVLKPADGLHLKAKSIIHGVENFVRNHDYTVIFDADNLAHPSFLSIMNEYANIGFEAIQGQRTAKNMDTKFAAMDALGEFYKNYIERYLSYLLGSSAVISGSGMAVRTPTYKAYLESPEIVKGKQHWKKMLQEDKILQNFLLRRDKRIAYAKDAICYDEKVTTAQGIETQRSRWLFSYFQNVPNAMGIIRRGIAHRSWNQFYFGLVTISPPLFILVFAACLLGTGALFYMPVVGVLIFLALVIFAGNILLTLKYSHTPKPVWKAIIGLPVFIFRQVRGLFKMGNPNKNFKHTEHTRNLSIDEVLSQKL